MFRYHLFLLAWRFLFPSVFLYHFEIILDVRNMALYFVGDICGTISLCGPEALEVSCHTALSVGRPASWSLADATGCLI